MDELKEIRRQSFVLLPVHRGQLGGGFAQQCMVGQAFRQCIACSGAVVSQYKQRGWPFVLEALQVRGFRMPLWRMPLGGQSCSVLWPLHRGDSTPQVLLSWRRRFLRQPPTAQVLGSRWWVLNVGFSANECSSLLPKLQDRISLASH
jgi:hypothetical protein